MEQDLDSRPYRLLSRDRFVILKDTPGPMAAAENQLLAAEEETLEATVEPIAEDQLWAKWIVITSIFSPSSDVARLAAIDGWRVVVVGDLNTPKDWWYPGVVYLGVEEQRQLSYGIVQRLPFDSYTRKNIGYLYAIEHGARYIYDTDDDTHPTGDRGQFGFRLGPSMTGLVHQDTRDVINQYAHFGQASIWPAGYPLNAIRRRRRPTTGYDATYRYKLCTFETPSIQQGMVDGDPDVDAIFRLTRSESSTTGLNVEFDGKTPPLTLAAGVYAPFNSQNTLFRYDAFWALFLPKSVAFRVTDLWRGYWTQRLMQLVGQRLAFLPPNAKQTRNVHDYLDDFAEEITMYVETELLVDFLKGWQCPAAPEVSSLFECMRRLSDDMAKAGFWGEEEPAMVDIWLSDLERVGYGQPDLMHTSSDDGTCLGKPTDARTVYFVPVVSREEPSWQHSRRLLDRADKLVEFCTDHLSYDISTRYVASSPDANRRIYIYDNVLLIIVVKHASFQVIPMLDNLYYDHFPNIAYCGVTADFEHLFADMAAADDQFAWIRRPGGVTFINTTAEEGHLSYECAVRAMQMNYAVDGYLVVGDDVLFNFWNLDFDVDLAAHNTSSYQTRPMYRYFGDTMANDTDTNRVLHDLERTRDRLLAKYFADVNDVELPGQVRFFHSDIFYVPAAKSALFRSVTEVFLRKHSFAEFAAKMELNRLYGTTLDYKERSNWASYYNSTSVYLHPVKLSYVLTRTEERRLYCETYARDLLHNVHGLM